MIRLMLPHVKGRFFLVAVRAVETHRAKVIRKLGLHPLAEPNQSALHNEIISAKVLVSSRAAGFGNSVSDHG
jgi:hypothetical protein